jgi:hypothetical protein
VSGDELYEVQLVLTDFGIFFSGSFP